MWGAAKTTGGAQTNILKGVRDSSGMKMAEKNAIVLQSQSQMQVAGIAECNARMLQGQSQIEPSTVDDVQAIKEVKRSPVARQSSPCDRCGRQHASAKCMCIDWVCRSCGKVRVFAVGPPRETDSSVETQAFRRQAGKSAYHGRLEVPVKPQWLQWMVCS